MAKSYWNGIIIGITLALLLLYASKNITAMNFIDDAIQKVVVWIQGIDSIPTSLTTWAYFDYLLASIVGLLIGLYIEYK